MHPTLRAILTFTYEFWATVTAIFGSVVVLGIILTIATGKLAGCCVGEVCLATMVPHTLAAAQEVE